MAKSIEVTLKFNDKDFTRGIRNANRQLNKLQRNLKQSGTGAKGLSGQQGMGGLTTAIAAVGAATVASSSKLSQQVRISSSFGTQISDNVQRLKNYFQSVKGSSKSSSELYNVTRRLSTANGELQGELGDLRRDLDGSGKGFTETGGKMGRFAIVAATVAAAVGAIAVSFQTLSRSIGVAAEFETIEITLSNLTGSAEKGARALEVITDKAQELPFAFSDLASASPVLLTVSKNLEEFQDNITLAADIAANFNIPFEQAASSLQRAFSAGAASADVFRERGVLSAAGFEAGVSYSVDQTIEKFREFGSEIDGVAQNLNQSLTGATSQAGDAFTLFQRELGNAIKPELTAFLLTLTTLARENKKDLDALAKTIGGAVFNGFVAIGRAVAITVDVFRTLISPVIALNNALNTMGTNLPIVATAIYVVVKAQKAFKTASLAAANAFIFLQGVTGVGLLKVGAGIAAAAATTALLTKAFDKAGESIADSGLDGDPDSALGKFNALLVDIKETASGLPEEVEPAGDSLKDLLVDISNIGANAADGVKDTRTALQKFRDDLEMSGLTVDEYSLFMERLNELFRTGEIGLEDYRAMLRDLDDTFGQNEGLNNFLDTLETANKTLSEDLVEAFRNGESATGSFKKMFNTLINQIIADVIRLSIIQPILGAIMAPFGFGFGSGGSIVKLPSGDGGGYTGGGVRSGGMDGKGGFPAILHPNETIIDHTRGQSMGGSQQVTYNINAVDAASFKTLVARDPEFIYNVTRVGSRRVPG